jgi:perosamine synthetase
LNLDADEFERRVTERTRAVIPVHMAGQPCEMGPLLEVARRRGIRVVEDAAHSLPARVRLDGNGTGDGEGWRSVGAIGDVTCFSFYATKTLTTGEGGMLVTEDDGWAERARVMSLHGISHDAWKRYTAEGSWYYEIHAPGFKYNMTDVAAALGLVQLRKCDRMRAVRERYARMYTEAFRGLPEIGLPAVLPGVEHAWHLFIVVLDLERLVIDRGEFIERLRHRGIGASVHFIPLHLHPFYRDTLGYRPEDFPNATWLAERNVSLPVYSKMSEGDVGRVIEAVREIVAEARR